MVKPKNENPKVNRKAKVVKKITKDMNLAEVVLKYPDVAEVLVDYGLHCVRCVLNTFDTIETGAKIHGLTEDEMNEMMKRVNEVIEYKE